MSSFPLFRLPQCFLSLMYTRNIRMFKHNLFIITCLQRSPRHKRQTSSFCFNHALLKLKSGNSGCLEATLSSVTNDAKPNVCFCIASPYLPPPLSPGNTAMFYSAIFFCRYLFERTVEGIQKPKGK